MRDISRVWQRTCRVCCRHMREKKENLRVETGKPSVLASNFRGCFPEVTWRHVQVRKMKHIEATE